jgi:hypothetical protein
MPIFCSTQNDIPMKFTLQHAIEIDGRSMPDTDVKVLAPGQIFLANESLGLNTLELCLREDPHSVSDTHEWMYKTTEILDKTRTEERIVSPVDVAGVLTPIKVWNNACSPFIRSILKISIVQRPIKKRTQCDHNAPDVLVNEQFICEVRLGHA